jgi:hypothetical protein
VVDTPSIAPAPRGPLVVELITPLRIKRHGRFVGARELAAEDLLRNLVSRLCVIFPKLGIGAGDRSRAEQHVECTHMPDDAGRLYLYEALELRSAYDREIRLLGRLVRPEDGRRNSLFAQRDAVDLRPAAGFGTQEHEARLKRLKVKRLKLNEAVQLANFRSEMPFDGESVSLARALELRKALLQELEQLAERAQESAYVRIVHKEERDIEKTPPRPFAQAYDEYEKALGRFRALVTGLHRANHEVTVAFRDE